MHKTGRRGAGGALLASATTLAALLPAGAADSVARAAEPDARSRVVVDTVVQPVREGETARVRLRVVTPGSAPLAGPVTVRYSPAKGSATPGEDLQAPRGTLSFPAGARSGTTRSIAVRTDDDGRAETAETLPLKLEVTGARAPRQRPTVVIDAHGLPYLDARRPVHERVADLLARMTPAEKAGQMTQIEHNALKAPGDLAARHIGSLIYGGSHPPRPNTPAAWAALTDWYQLRARTDRLQIPVLHAIDAVHGHNTVVGATIMPHNIGLGASRDPSLVARAAAVTAVETRATGIPWTFAPCLCVSRDERWGRAYESFGEDPELVKAMTTAVQGLQGAPDGSELHRRDRVMATAKHFVADGATAFGSSTHGDGYTVDQGIARITREELESVHLPPFAEAVRRGVGTVMPSFSSLDLAGDGQGPVRMHAYGELINGVLKDGMGFDGFVVSDWKAIDQIPGDYATDVRTAVNAGVDMNMVPHAYREFQDTLLAQVRAGRVPQSRIDDAVARILTRKFQLGLFERPFADTTHLDRVGSAEHRAVAREAVAKSQVLLKNDGVLPLSPGQKVYLAGSNADDLGHQTGGWTITWQGSSGDITEGTTIREALRAAAPGARMTYSEDASAPTDGHDVGVVVVGETPYAEGRGDVGNGGHDLLLPAADRKAVDAVCGAMRCVVLVVSGRPQIVTGQLDAMDALVASWLPGTEGAGVADVLYGKRPFTGRLPVSWPRSAEQVPVNVGDTDYDPLFPYGWGLTTDVPAAGAGWLAVSGPAAAGDRFRAGEPTRAVRAFSRAARPAR
ncbi:MULTISPECIES: glycoside hydrolase family 3 N-terminal domain-containing protein [unclassified Streptomyces]|uniref:glycoside hydrolase family 3 N-terminal domain-containing protein n=1 Tax=unclassified Streptomyces TaxID=2593676 RepID=UPI0022B609D2|nr:MULTISPECIES: glycoside hydrolase family 3 N-terminal domain-containing protein [unclassified Streptomyces]MCZ7413926.1 glycoside hydrolase family 3 C-terminal domain-containing protein [Streptomyces sp. WMMC897]MCZ7430922.1 glycoside hydrolase family 3 C-terminal domain-containing protein [Streptomyces sp. WMMC1477]